MQEINIYFFQILNNLTSHSMVATLSQFFADFPILFLPIFLVAGWIYYTYTGNKRNQKELLLFLFYSCVIAIGISLIIQQFIHFERPETAITSSGKLLLSHIPDASFPSDHASVGVAFLLGLLLAGYTRFFLGFLPFVVLMLISRIIVGVHWPFDIIVGSIVGIISAIIAFTQLPKIKFVKNVNSFIIRILSYIKL